MANTKAAEGEFFEAQAAVSSPTPAPVPALIPACVCADAAVRASLPVPGAGVRAGAPCLLAGSASASRSCLPASPPLAASLRARGTRGA